MPGKRGVILFVHGADEWYGSDYVLYEIVAAIRDTEFTPVVVVPDDVTSEIPSDRRLSGRLRELGVRVHQLPVAVLRRKYMTPLGVLKLSARARSASAKILGCVANDKVVLVHTHTAGVMSGADVARKLGVPHLWHVSEIVVRPWIVGVLLARRIARSADWIVTVSGAVRAHLLSSQPDAATRSEVIYNSVCTRRFEDVSGTAYRGRFSPDNVPVVGLVGRVGMSKGQELLLDAMRDVVRRFPEVRIALVGGVLDGRIADLAALRTHAERCGLADRVTIDGYTDDVPAVLAAMDIVVQPSLRPDSLPTTVLEAMASRKPVIAAENGGSSEMVVQGETGMLFPTGDAGALSNSIVALLEDGSLRERMGRAGRQRVEALFSPTSFRRAYLARYRALSRV